MGDEDSPDVKKSKKGRKTHEEWKNGWTKILNSKQEIVGSVCGM